MSIYFVFVIFGLSMSSPVFSGSDSGASDQESSGLSETDIGIMAGVLGAGALLAAPDIINMFSSSQANKDFEARSAAKKLTEGLDGPLDMETKHQLVGEFEKNVGSVAGVRELASQRKKLRKEQEDLQKDIDQARLGLAHAAPEEKAAINQRLASLSERLTNNRNAQDENVHKQLQAGIQLHQEHERDRAVSRIEVDLRTKEHQLTKSLSELSGHISKYSALATSGLTEEQVQHKKQLEAQVVEYKKQIEALPQERERLLAAVKSEEHGLSPRVQQVLKETRNALAESLKVLEGSGVRAHSASRVFAPSADGTHLSLPRAASEHAVLHVHSTAPKKDASGAKKPHLVAKKEGSVVGGRVVARSASSASVLRDKHNAHSAPKRLPSKTLKSN